MLQFDPYLYDQIKKSENNFNYSVASLIDIYRPYLDNREERKYDILDHEALKKLGVKNIGKFQSQLNKAKTKQKNVVPEDKSLKNVYVNNIDLGSNLQSNFPKINNNFKGNKLTDQKRLESVLTTKKFKYDQALDPAQRNRIIDVNFLHMASLPESKKFSHVPKGVISPVQSTFSVKRIVEDNIKKHEKMMRPLVVYPDKVRIFNEQPAPIVPRTKSDFYKTTAGIGGGKEKEIVIGEGGLNFKRPKSSSKATKPKKTTPQKKDSKSQEKYRTPKVAMNYREKAKYEKEMLENLKNKRDSRTKVVAVGKKKEGNLSSLSNISNYNKNSSFNGNNNTINSSTNLNSTVNKSKDYTITSSELVIIDKSKTAENFAKKISLGDDKLEKKIDDGKSKTINVMNTSVSSMNEDKVNLTISNPIQISNNSSTNKLFKTSSKFNMRSTDFNPIIEEVNESEEINNEYKIKSVGFNNKITVVDPMKSSALEKSSSNNMNSIMNNNSFSNFSIQKKLNSNKTDKKLNEESKMIDAFGPMPGKNTMKSSYSNPSSGYMKNNELSKSMKEFNDPKNVTLSRVINDGSETINKMLIKPEDIKVNTKQYVQDDRFNAFSIEFPPEYYYNLSKENEPNLNKDWYIRPHHTETFANSDYAIPDDIMNTKYISYYSPNDDNKEKTRQDILEELITETHKKIDDLQSEMYKKSVMDKNAGGIYKKLQGMREEVEKNFDPRHRQRKEEKQKKLEEILLDPNGGGNYDELFGRNEEVQQTNLAIGAFNDILDDLRSQEHDLLLKKRREEYERIRPPLDNWYTLKGEEFTNELKRNEMVLNSGPEYFEKINELQNEEFY